MTVITQVQGLKPKDRIEVDGICYELRKNATDPTTSFMHERVQWTGAGCEQISQNPPIHFCWVTGTVPATAGTLETPANVVYVGFHSQKISMNPTSLSPTDRDNMHVYVASASNFANKFAMQYLGVSNGTGKKETRTPIEPFPSGLTQEHVEDMATEEAK